MNLIEKTLVLFFLNFVLKSNLLVNCSPPAETKSNPRKDKGRSKSLGTAPPLHPRAFVIDGSQEKTDKSVVLNRIGDSTARLTVFQFESNGEPIYGSSVDAAALEKFRKKQQRQSKDNPYSKGCESSSDENASSSDDDTKSSRRRRGRSLGSDPNDKKKINKRDGSRDHEQVIRPSKNSVKK